MLLLASLSRSYKPLVQTLLVGRTMLKLDEVITTLQENDRIMRSENINGEDHVLAVEESE